MALQPLRVFFCHREIKIIMTYLKISAYSQHKKNVREVDISAHKKIFPPPKRISGAAFVFGVLGHLEINILEIKFG